MSVLTRNLMMVYFASAMVFAITLLWLVLGLVGVVSHPPGLLLIGSCLLMLTAKIASGWTYRRDMRDARR